MEKVCAMCQKPLPKGRRRFCTDKCRNRSRQVALYGLTPEDQTALKGNGECPICGKRVKKWNIDHDHNTNLVRGMVCGRCNQRVLTVVGSVDKAKRLVVYLESPPANKLEGPPRTVGARIQAKKGRYYGR